MNLKRIYLIIIMGVILIAGGLNRGNGIQDVLAASHRQPRSSEIEVEPELQNRILTGEGDIGYLIYFRERPDLSPAAEMDWTARGRFVADSLQAAASISQGRVRAYLDSQGVSYQSFWVDNIIVVNQGSSEATFNGLMAFPEIAAIRARRHPILHEPVSIPMTASSINGIESNIQHVGADQVWAMGYTGAGITVANIDTGVRYTHEALVNQYRGNMGSYFDHNYNWWDPAIGGSELVPNDFHNHGSHTMGIILGDDGGSYQVGMAPGATWIACQAFEVNDEELLECGQFILAPWDLTGANPNPDLRPHIVNNSWGDCETSLDPWYKGIVASWQAAGIYPVFSNGNASNCGYATPPGLNTVGNPARYGEITGVGSTGKDDGLYATHSNWGPTDDLDTANPNGYPNLKPQVVAPGVNILSAVRYSDSSYATMSGTSMSAPHVAGLIALMWEAAPCLIGDQVSTETILQETAKPVPYNTNNGDEGPGFVPNHATGWGEIDAPAAVQAAIDYCAVSVEPDRQDVCRPGQTEYDIRVGEVFEGPVHLSLDGLPEYASASFSMSPVTPPGESVLTITVPISTTVGDYPLDIFGTFNQQTYSTTFVLGVDGTNLIPPTLLDPANEAIGISTTPYFAWSAIEQVDYYHLEVADSVDFSNVVYTTTLQETGFKLPMWLDYLTPYYWRVLPQNACGDGPISSISIFTTEAPPPILLVDDDDNAPDVRDFYTSTLDTLGYAYAIWDTQRSDNEPDSTFLSNFEMAIWFTGNAWNSSTGPGPAGETALSTWLERGGCFLISSQDYQYARGLTPFMMNYLGADTIEDFVLQTSVTGAGSVFSDLGFFNLVYPDGFGNYSDRIEAGSDAEVAFIGNSGNAAVNKISGTYKTSYWGFPFEALSTTTAREASMQTFLHWCEAGIIYLPLVIK